MKHRAMMWFYAGCWSIFTYLLYECLQTVNMAVLVSEATEEAFA